MGNKKILIVDDDPDVTLGMHLRLRANQYDTYFAADAPSSVAEARKYAPDLIVLDLGLPSGDGYLVMESLKKVPSLAHIPVIVVSARASRRQRRTRPHRRREGFPAKTGRQCCASGNHPARIERPSLSLKMNLKVTRTDQASDQRGLTR